FETRSLIEELPRTGCLCAYAFGSLFEVVGDFEDAACCGRQRGDVFGYRLPVNLAGAGPEVVVLGALIVVQMKLGDARLEEFKGCVDAAVAQVGVAYIESD